MNHWDKKPPLRAKAARRNVTGKVMAPDQLSLFSPLAEKTRRPSQVRQPQQERVASAGSEASPSPLAHLSNGLLIQLNPQWRVIDDDLQYILQNRKGNSRSKATGWKPRSFCRTREALLRCIREYCGSVDENAVAQVRALPEWHIDRR